AFTFVAESMDRSGMGVATLAPRTGMRAEVPALRDPPILTMADMGMAGMDHGAPGGAMDHSQMDHSKMSADEMAKMDMPGMDMSGGDGIAGMDMSGMKMRDTSMLPPDVKVGPGLDMVSMNAADRMDYPGIGLDKVDHRVLNYKQLAALTP